MGLRYAAGTLEFLKTVAPRPRRNLRDALRLMETDARHEKLDLKLLRKEGPVRFYRARVRDYRIVFSPMARHTFIWRIQHRRDGYAWLDSFDPWD